MLRSIAHISYYTSTQHVIQNWAGYMRNRYFSLEPTLAHSGMCRSAHQEMLYLVSLLAVGNPKISTYSVTSLICSVWDPYQALRNTLALAFHWHEPWKDRVANPDNPSFWQKFKCPRFFHPGIRAHWQIFFFYFNFWYIFSLCIF